MYIQKNEQLAEKLLDEMMAEINEDRSRMHPSVTDLIDCLTKSYYNAGGIGPQFTTQTKIYFLIGLGLERALLVDRKGLPTYGETDGIHWHVDSLDDGLIEVKSTRANPKKAEDGLSPRWIRQVKSYLKAIGKTYVDIAVVYLIQAEFIVWRVNFEQKELDEHWAWMQERKEIWEKASVEGVSPKAFTTNEAWECKDCAYKLVCQTKSRMGL